MITSHFPLLSLWLTKSYLHTDMHPDAFCAVPLKRQSYSLFSLQNTTLEFFASLDFAARLYLSKSSAAVATDLWIDYSPSFACIIIFIFFLHTSFTH